MLQDIKNAKVKLLESLKAERLALDAVKKKLADEKYAVKRVAADAKCSELTVALENYKRDKLAQLNKELAEYAAQVEAKKAEILNGARADADNEAALEISTQTAEYDSEIAKLEAELA